MPTSRDCVPSSGALVKAGDNTMVSNILSSVALSSTSLSMVALLIKATLILVVALGITLSMQRASAGARHLVWLVTLATLLLVPALAAWAPIPLRILPAEKTVSGSGPSFGNAPVMPKADKLSKGDKSPTTSAPSSLSAPTSPVSLETEIATSPILSGLSLVLFVWAIVVVGIAASLGYAAMLVKRIVNRARPLTGEDWLGHVYEVS